MIFGGKNRRRGGSMDRLPGGEGGEGSGGGVAVAMKFNKLSKISISVIVQTTAAMISFRFSGQSSLSKVLLVSTLVTNLLGYISRWSSILMMPELAKHKEMPEAAEILGGIGIVACALGFIQMIALSLLANLVWIVMLLNHTTPKVTEILGWIGIVVLSCLAFYTNDSFVPLCQSWECCFRWLHTNEDIKIEQPRNLQDTFKMLSRNLCLVNGG